MRQYKKIKRIHILFVCLFIVIVSIPFHRKIRRCFESFLQTLRGKYTVNDRIKEYGEIVKNRLKNDFKNIATEYPPEFLVYICLKQEHKLEVWASRDDKTYMFVKSYPVLGLSGSLGPKLKEGDGQVPEGIYIIDSLNPNSAFHLSIRLDYPNDFDRTMGKNDKRLSLGSDIMIHGKTCSVGCLAMGDLAAEDLFILSAQTGIDNVKIIISPIDFRINKLPENMPELPKWSSVLYSELKIELQKYK